MARRRGLRPVLVPALCLLAFSSVAMADRGGPGSAPTAIASSSSGSLSIFNSRGDSAVLSATGLAPGSSTTGDVTIQNNGAVRGGFSLASADVVESPGPGGGLLSQRLQLVVIDLGSTGAVYTGPLGGLGSRDLGVFGPGEARTYRFTATLPDTGIPPTPLGGDNAYQGASLRNTYVWTGTELDTQPVAPGGNPPGGNPPGSNPSGRGPGKTAPLQLRVGLVRRQPAFKKRKLVFKITCNYACSFNATGRLAKGRVRLRGRARASHRHQATLTLRISKKSAKRLARALRSRRGTAMTLIVVARDASGRKVTFRRAVALKQVGRGRRAKVRMTWQKPPKPKKKKARR